MGFRAIREPFKNRPYRVYPHASFMVSMVNMMIIASINPYLLWSSIQEEIEGSRLIAYDRLFSYTYRMAQRTTILLDEEVRQAARQLALKYGCSTSEAIRRAIVRHRDTVFGVPVQSRRERKRVLNRLFDLFEGHDAIEEINQLKSEDEGF